MARWGATESDHHSQQPGDEIVASPDYLTTHAVTIAAPAGAVWPWLAQMGYGRGGLYSYDWLDRAFGYLDAPSADRILPEYQNIAPGDVIPLGNGPDWPVHTAIPNRALVLTPDAPGFDISWAFILNEVDPHTTRLVSRVRAKPGTRTAAWPLMKAFLEPVAFLMERGMLLGIRARAERLARETTAAPA